MSRMEGLDCLVSWRHTYYHHRLDDGEALDRDRRPLERQRRDTDVEGMEADPAPAAARSAGPAPGAGTSARHRLARTRARHRRRHARYDAPQPRDCRSPRAHAWSPRRCEGAETSEAARLSARSIQGQYKCTRGTPTRTCRSHKNTDFIGFSWCPGGELNTRHCDFQSHALPTELPGHD